MIKNCYHHNVRFGCHVMCVLVMLVSGRGYCAEPEQLISEGQTLYPEAVAEEEIEPAIVGLDEYSDPLESFNRVIFAFNDTAYRFALIPLGNVYEAVIVEPVRDGISRFFSNLQEPLYLVNHTAQGNITDAGNNLFRFLTNTIIGIGGLFDPAQSWFGVGPATTTFNSTLADYGVPAGAYLVLPFLGGADLRRGTSVIVSSSLHPVRLLTHQPETTYFIVFDNFQTVAPDADSYIELKTQAEDPYIYFRNQYLQGNNRDQQIQGENEE